MTSDAEHAAVRVKAVRKRFGYRDVLRGVHLEVAPKSGRVRPFGWVTE